MTPDHDPARKSLESERAELADQLDACVTRSGGIDLRDPELLRRAASALRSLAAQDQKPAAYQWLHRSQMTGEPVWRPEQFWNGHKSQTHRMLYLSPPKAAGWNEAIEAACEICREAVDPANSSSHIAAAEEIREQIEALRHNAPPDTGAGKSATNPVVSIQQMCLSGGRTDYFVSIKVGDREVTPHVFREEYKSAYHVALYSWLLNGTEKPDMIAFGPDEWPAVAKTVLMPDHGGADAGVWKALERARDALRKVAASRRAIGPIATMAQQAAWEASEALSHQPAPVAANASAEARVREALTTIAAISACIAVVENPHSHIEMLSNINGVAVKALKDHAALSHASDCDKQKECCDLAAKEPCPDCPHPVTVCVSTKPEGGVEGHAIPRTTSATTTRYPATEGEENMVAPARRTEEQSSTKTGQAGIKPGPSDREKEAAMTEDQIKHMVDRFLGWKLPRDTFNPDCGISFDKEPFNTHTPYPSQHEPSGTNLFDATQATAMVRYMLEGLPRPNASAEVRLREAILASIDMIEGCHDAPKNPDSMPQMIKVHLQQAISTHPHAADCDKQGER